jgi:Mce-associated membrane protein
MPPSRRRPVSPPVPPARRPKVAGLRHPGTSAEPKPAIEPQPEQPEQTESTAVFPTITEPVEPEAEPTAGQEPNTAPVPTPSPRPRSEPEFAASAEAPAESESEATGQTGGWRQAVAWRPTVTQRSAEDGQPRRTSPLFVVLALALATVLFGGLAAWFGLRAVAAGQANDNSALTDNATTSQVIGQVNNAANTIFSYKYTDVGATKAAAQNLLVDNALCQYNNIYKAVQQYAPSQKLVVTLQVINSGVEMLQGDQARVLVFADQQDTRADINQTTYAGSQFAVTVHRINGQWKIADIDTFSDQAATNAGCKAN